MIAIPHGFYPLQLDGLPPSWATAYLRDLASEVQPGFASGDHNRERNGIPQLRMTNVTREGNLDLTRLEYVPHPKATRIRKGEILFTNTNSFDLVGKTTVFAKDGEWTLSNHMTRVRLHEGLDPAFYARQLHCLWMLGYFRHRCTRHVNQASFGTEALKNTVPLVVPPLPEQRRIVEAIETNFARLDVGVAAILRCRAAMKRYRETLLHAACHGLLVPTEAELARSDSRKVVTANAMIANLEDERLAAQKELGTNRDLIDPNKVSMPEDPLPAGWGWFPWVRLAGRITVGYVGPISSEHRQEGVPLIRSQNIRPCRFSEEGMSHVSHSFLESNPKNVARGGDLCVVRSGNVGTTCALPADLGDVCVSDLVIIQRPIGILPAYGAYVMNSIARSRIVSGKVGIGLSHYNTRSVASLPVPLPPLEEQARIVAEVERRLSIADEVEMTVESEVARSLLLRQAVLRSAFQGHLVPQDPTDPPATTFLGCTEDAPQLRARKRE